MAASKSKLRSHMSMSIWYGTKSTCPDSDSIARKAWMEAKTAVDGGCESTAIVSRGTYRAKSRYLLISESR